jgi:hypothetical protein
MDCFGYYPLLPRLADHAAIQLHQESVALHRGLFQLAVQSSGVACLVMIIFFSAGTSRRMLFSEMIFREQLRSFLPAFAFVLELVASQRPARAAAGGRPAMRRRHVQGFATK